MNDFELLFGPTGWSSLLLKGAAVTVLLALITLPVGVGAGLALALLERSPYRAIQLCSRAYVTFFRGIPDLLVLFIIYFGLQALIDRLVQFLALDQRFELNSLFAGAIALAMVVAAYASQIWVGALSAVPRSQIDAAQALGLGKASVFFLIVLPQSGRIALPALGNIWNSLLKDTSIVSTIAVMDLLRAASEASRATALPMLFYGAAAVIYIFLGIISAIGQRWLMKRLGGDHP